MAKYTVKYVGTCSGGGHISWNIYKDGIMIKEKFCVNKEDILSSDIRWQDVLVFLMVEAVKSSDATTALQAKAAIEAREWVL